MNVRESKRAICPYANTSKDLLVCLPSRSHLTLVPSKRPKPICSPAKLLRASQNRHRKKLLALRYGGSEQAPDHEIAEPASPKVTCAGQVKVRPASSGKNWQTVMEEIEKLHERRHAYKRASSPSSSSPLWFKKDVTQFFACLRSIRFDFRCFGAFPSSAASDDDDEEEEEEEEEDTGTQNTDDGGEPKPHERAMFSKWFMVLEEPQNPEASSAEEASGEDCGSVVPPRNALLLMRCRSAPPKSWLLEEKVGSSDDIDDGDGDGDEEEDVVADDEERSSSRTMAEMYEGESLVEMRYGKKLCTISTDIVKETWVVEGNTKEPLSRSRSWKR